MNFRVNESVLFPENVCTFVRECIRTIFIYCYINNNISKCFMKEA